MSHWLLKTEPATFSWSDLVREKRSIWDGVRNHQAANNLRAMKKGDLVFIYHSVTEKSVVGIAKIIRTAYPDPKDPAWVAVDIAPVNPLTPVTLANMRSTPKLKTLIILRHTHLSVAPVSEHDRKEIQRLSHNATSSPS